MLVIINKNSCPLGGDVMTDAWEERKKALENKYFHDLEKELIEKIREETREKLMR